MKTVLKWILIIIAIIVAIFVVGGLIIPSKWTVQETTTISAPADKVYEQIANLRNWQNWSPWTKENDQTQVYTYEGPETGVGAKWLWTSEKMGKGYLEIKDANVSKGISYELFIDMNNSPSTINGSINYVVEDSTLKIVWTDEGDSGNNLIKRWIAALFIKGMLAKEMRAGLLKLKSITEVK